MVERRYVIRLGGLPGSGGSRDDSTFMQLLYALGDFSFLNVFWKISPLVPPTSYVHKEGTQGKTAGKKRRGHTALR